MKETYINEKITPGKHTSAWFYDVLPVRSEPLTESTEAEVLIIGAGISGLTIAYCLLKEGKKVTVIEDGYIGSGETGHTTAHLVTALDDRYYTFDKLFGKAGSKLIADSHSKAIDLVEKIVTDEKIDCDFKRLSGYLFLHPSDKEDSLQKELEAAKDAGIDVEITDGIPGIRHSGPSLEFRHQARIHPMKYLNGLYRAIISMGGKVYTETRAEKIAKGVVSLRGNMTVKAQYIVVATNTPFNNRVVMHTKQYAYRTYVIAAKITRGSLPDALWWDTGDMEASSTVPPYHYIRLQEHDDKHDLLICGGEDHATGLADADGVPEEDRYGVLEAWVREHFDIGEIIWKWSEEVLEPMDSLAYIGRNPMDDEHVYIVTGDSGNGMTHANVAGMLITDLIMGRENPWTEIYDPSRVKWITAGDVFLKEFVGGFFTYLKNKPDTDPAKIFGLKKDEGTIVKWNNKTCGVFRDNEDALHVVDATCTHLGCTVKWNNDEKSWDCPCHGSRFSITGKVLNGPAAIDLPHYEDKYPEVSGINNK